jgi:hypothetical protein
MLTIHLSVSLLDLRWREAAPDLGRIAIGMAVLGGVDFAAWSLGQIRMLDPAGLAVLSVALNLAILALAVRKLWPAWAESAGLNPRVAIGQRMSK